MKVIHVHILCVALLPIAILGCSETSEESTTQPTNSTQEQVAVGQPVLEPTAIGADITLQWDERDFGEIWDFESVTTTFPFTNTGTKTLVLNRLQAGCGCTVPVADKTVLKPGESGTITVTYNPSGKSGKEDKKISIFSNSVNSPVKVFWIRSYVKQFVRIQDRFLKLNEMAMGQPHSLEFEFFPSDPNFEIISMRGTGKHGEFVSAEEVEVPDGAPRRIRINVSPNRPWGAFHSLLSVTGRGVTPQGTPVNHAFTVFANGKTFGQLRSDQYIFSLGSVREGGTYHKRIHLFRADGAPFSILNTAVLQPTVSGINATSVQQIDGSYEIIVSGTLPTVSAAQRSFEAQVMVQTDVNGEEVLKFRIAASIPRN